MAIAAIATVSTCTLTCQLHQTGGLYDLKLIAVIVRGKATVNCASLCGAALFLVLASTVSLV
eukprot:224236-Amphidinium_carterae.1